MLEKVFDVSHVADLQRVWNPQMDIKAGYSC